MLTTRYTIIARKILVLALVVAGLMTASLAVAECLPGQIQEANLQYQSAAEFLSAKQWDQAISRLQSIIQVCPEHVDATRGIGTAFLGKKQFDQAIPYFSRVIELRGNDAEAGDHANLATAYAQLKQYKEARAEFLKAQQLAPDDCGVLFNLGLMHYAAGFYPQSVEVLERTLEVCPQIKDHVLKQLATSAEKAAAQQRKAGNNDRAQYYDNLLTTYGGQAGGSTTYDMVRQKMKAKDYAAAVDLLKQLLAKEPEHTGGLLSLARSQDQLGNKSASIEAYQKYLAIKPQDLKTHGAMIQVMVEAGKCSDAAANARATASQFEGQGRDAMAPVMYSWGLALECQGDFEAAKAKFQNCATSGNSRYADFGRRQVDRMDGLKAREDAEKKKAAQGG